MPAFSLIVAALAQPFFGVYWASLEHRAVTVKAYGFEQNVKECLDASMEAKIRYEIQICRRRTAWFDSCVEPRTENHSIAFDSITESYRVVVDRHGDEAEPSMVGIPSRAEAVVDMITLEAVSLSHLSRDEVRLLSEGARYVQIRGVFSCKGSVNRTIARLSHFLTFGLVNVVESDSGWFDFALDGGMTNLE
jgi:hypothetical protein